MLNVRFVLLANVGKVWLSAKASDMIALNLLMCLSDCR